MSKFLDYFGKPHVVLPVVHIDTYENGLTNIQIAKECGADGVFIISHGEIYGKQLLNFQLKYMEEAGWDKIGINCLGESFLEMIVAGNVGGMGVWIDNAHVRENRPNTEIADLKKQFDEKNLGLYFGGVAFKYQPQPNDLSHTAALARDFVDVITTSGKGTGHAADLDKMKTIRTAAGDFPIGIASGITPENIESYLPYTNAFLVATGISKDFTHLDADKLSELIAKVNAYQP